MADQRFDVFLCHNSEDKPAVIQIAEQLQQHSLKPWLDDWEIRPGTPFLWVLEQQITSIGAAAVFVGKAGIGPWQQEEIYAFLTQFVRRKCPVIPVLLPDAPQQPSLPTILENRRWVDFRVQQPDPIAQLVFGITGQRSPSTLEKGLSGHLTITPNSSKGSTSIQSFADELRILEDLSDKINRISEEKIKIRRKDISSSEGISYRKLQNLLVAGKWKEADQETDFLLIQASNRSNKGYLDERSLRKVSFNVLQTIDNLWQKYSEGRFGFTPQKQIWIIVEENFNRFCKEVGWYSEGSPITVLQYSIKAPMGHLPSLECAVSTSYMKAIWEDGRITSGPVAFWLARKGLIARIVERLSTFDEELDDDLSSEKSIDYCKLRDLLKAGKWKEADQETSHRMCEAMGGRKKSQSLVPISEEEMQAFPCTDLNTIDALWVKYSKGRFGFSIQKRIWNNCGKPIDFTDLNWRQFGDTVGWHKGGFWIDCKDINYISTAPYGHLPSQLIDMHLCGPFLEKSTFRYWASFLSHNDL